MLQKNQRESFLIYWAREFVEQIGQKTLIQILTTNLSILLKVTLSFLGISRLRQTLFAKIISAIAIHIHLGNEAKIPIEISEFLFNGILSMNIMDPYGSVLKAYLLTVIAGLDHLLSMCGLKMASARICV